MISFRKTWIFLCAIAAAVLCHPAEAVQFQSKIIRLDTRIERPIKNDGQTVLPLLEKGQTFGVEIFIEDARSLRTLGYVIAFFNQDSRFSDFFAIESITGILPQDEKPGPTSISSLSGKPAVIGSNDYLATVTLAVKRNLPLGLRLRLDPIRTRIIDANMMTADIPNVNLTQIDFGRPNYELFLDLDTAPGNQGLTETFGIKSDTEITIQIFGERIQYMNGFILRFEYDGSQIAFDSFEAGAVLPSVQTLDPAITQLDSPFVDVEVTAASFGGSAQSDNGLLGMLKFKPLEAFKRSGVRMTLAEIRRGGQFRPYFAPLFVDLVALNTDFDGDGFVGFRDFVLFAEHFGARSGDSAYEDRFDLVPDGEINFADFVIFSESLTVIDITVID